MKSLTHLWVTLSTFVAPRSKKNDTGASMLEYAAVIILVTAVAVAIYALGLPNDISEGIRGEVARVLRGPAE